MNNRSNITNVLDELSIIYKIQNSESDDSIIDIYMINLFVDNLLVSGGIFDGGKSDDKHISLFFYFDNEGEALYDKGDGLVLANNFNQNCKYGTFFLDDDDDIVYSLSIPAIGEEYVDKEVFRFYFESTISVIKSAARDLINYGQR